MADSAPTRLLLLSSLFAVLCFKAPHVESKVQHSEYLGFRQRPADPNQANAICPLQASPIDPEYVSALFSFLNAHKVTWFGYGGHALWAVRFGSYGVRVNNETEVFGDNDIDLAVLYNDGFTGFLKKVCHAGEFSPHLLPCYMAGKNPDTLKYECIPVKNLTEFHTFRLFRYLRKRNCTTPEMINTPACIEATSFFNTNLREKYVCSRIYNRKWFETGLSPSIKYSDVNIFHLRREHLTFMYPREYNLPRDFVFPLETALINNITMPVPRNPVRFFSFYRPSKSSKAYEIDLPEYGQGCSGLAYNSQLVREWFDLKEGFSIESYEKIRTIERQLMLCAENLHRQGYSSFRECYHLTDDDTPQQQPDAQPPNDQRPAGYP